MTRRLAEKQEGSTQGRLKRYLEIDRTQGPEGSHPAAKALHERPATRAGSARMREFARIDRGDTA